MSTRCDVYKLDKIADKPVLKCIYCHHDGYPEGVGAMLTEHYTAEEKIDRLLAGGDTSSIEEEVEKCAFYNEWQDDGETDPYDIIYLENFAGDVKPETDKAILALAKQAIITRESGSDREYYYLWDGQKWHCWDWDGINRKLYDET